MAADNEGIIFLNAADNKLHLHQMGLHLLTKD